jgi:hypothetical protein
MIAIARFTLDQPTQRGWLAHETLSRQRAPDPPDATATASRYFRNLSKTESQEMRIIPEGSIW